MINGDAKGRRCAIQDHAETPGVGLDDTAEGGAAGKPGLQGLVPDEVKARGEGHHHARAAIVLRHGF